MTVDIQKEMLCPCGAVESAKGRRLKYADCCQLLHHGQPASSPQALMRSRYAAYALNIEDYLIRSWHPDFRPAQWSSTSGIRWCQLAIKDASEHGSKGVVSFAALYFTEGKWYQLKEKSHFVKHQQDWFYTQGKAQTAVFHPKRNEPCPCGSGLKAKRCCSFQK